MDESSTPKPKQLDRSRSSRRLSLSSRTSSVMGFQLPESDPMDAKWRTYLIEMLGEEGADYFINPKPKEHRIAIDSSLYRYHDLNEAWLMLRRKAEARLQQEARKKRSISVSRNEPENADDLDAAYFAFGRYLLNQKGRQLPARAFWEKEHQFREQLSKLSDKHVRHRAARFNQETGVSFRAAQVNTERCNHLMEQSAKKGTNSFNTERKTKASVFTEDFSEYDGSVVDSREFRDSTAESLNDRRKIRGPNLIFLTSQEATEEAEQLTKLWKEQKKEQSKGGVLSTIPKKSDHPQASAATFEPNSKWQPLAITAAAEWGKVITKSH